MKPTKTKKPGRWNTCICHYHDKNKVFHVLFVAYGVFSEWELHDVGDWDYIRMEARRIRKGGP